MEVSLTLSVTSVVSEGLRRGSAAARLLELVGSNPAGDIDFLFRVLCVVR